MDSRKSGDILGIEKRDRIIASTGTRVLKLEGGKDIHPEEIVALRTSLGLFSRYFSFYLVMALAVRMITILMIYDGDTALPGDGLCYKTTS